MAAHWIHSLTITSRCNTSIGVYWHGIQAFMKSVFIALCIACFGQPLYSQGGDEFIPFFAYWNKGDSHDFQLPKVKKVWRGDMLARNDSIVQIVNFRVADSTETGFTIHWKVISGSPFDFPSPYESILVNHPVKEIIYTTTEDGAYADVLNWQEIAEQFRAMYHDIMTQFTLHHKINKDSFQLLMRPMLEVFKTKEGVEQFMMAEIKLMHLPLGLTIPIAKPITYKEDLATVFGTAPVVADVRMYIDSLDKATAFCVLVQELQTNSKDTREMLRSLLSKMNIKSSEAEKELKKAVYTIQDNNRFAYYYYPGIPYNVESIRQSNMSITGQSVRTYNKSTLSLLANK
jgi:hypothetical protein